MAYSRLNRSHLLRYILLHILIYPCTSFVTLSWNTTHYFGLDGPWQAVTVGVQGRDLVVDSINLLPGASGWEPAILRNVVCASNRTSAADDQCGVGGTVSLPSGDGVPTNPDVRFSSDIENTTNMSGWGYSISGKIRRVPLNIGQHIIDNATIAGIDVGVSTYPNGKVYGSELGFFFLGGGGLSNNNIECPDYACNPVGYMYTSGITSSYSFGLHIGSVAHSYPGSIIFGGYDKGRVIGPALITRSLFGGFETLGDLRLLDINIGVEGTSNDSPFPSFDVAPRILHPAPIPVLVDPGAPYIFLPQTTVDNLVSKLPVHYDLTSRYYLWDATDPLYERIITSRAYLGFNMSGANNGDTIEIKVPFALLNLTLEPAASGLDSAVPYFPVLAMQTQSFNAAYTLGRAFLQAAFIGANWGQNTSWLAQAPGPGPKGQGLGYEAVDLGNATTELSAKSGADLFARSWDGIWAPLSSNDRNLTSSGDHAPGSGAIAGIVLGTVVFCIAVGALIFVILRRRKRKLAARSNAHGNKQGDRGELSALPRKELEDTHIAHEMPGHGNQMHEMPDRLQSPQELHGEGKARELHTGEHAPQELSIG